jgi:Protein of unknown function (DUF4087)
MDLFIFIALCKLLLQRARDNREERIMKQPFFIAALFVAMTVTAQAETRCGWVINSGPGNWSLQDADAEWMFGVQGGEQALGSDELPDFSEHDWVDLGPSHGYGCACFGVETSNGDITRILNVKQLRLSRCQSDHKLPKPNIE